MQGWRGERPAGLRAEDWLRYQLVLALVKESELKQERRRLRRSLARWQFVAMVATAAALTAVLVANGWIQ